MRCSGRHWSRKLIIWRPRTFSRRPGRTKVRWSDNIVKVAGKSWDDVRQRPEHAERVTGGTKEAQISAEAEEEENRNIC